ncbi:MAG: peptidoglycan editing factor PgeF [Rhodoferax sp.]
MNDAIQTVNWPAPAGIRAGYTTRHGGVSEPPFDTLNLGDHVGDGVQAVASNRQRLAQWVGCRPVFLQQVHGTAVVTIDAQTPDGIEADASLSTQTGVACVVLVADCLPVLLTSADGRVVAAAHAGWRGLAGRDGRGVIEVLVERIHAMFALRQAPELMAWLGPCIGPTAFEVGPDVVAAFGPEARLCFRPGRSDRHYWADLPALARQRLRACGVAQIFGNDGSPSWCTWTRGADFFSYRRDRVCGRQSAWIARVAAAV